jgi:4-amino-4-deoxy-L-arabinose transferase-like glycosyltransferase
MKKAWNTILAMGRPVLFGLLGLLIVSSLFLYKLSSLTPGLSQSEIDTYNTTRNLSEITDNSVNAPYRLAVLASTTLFDNSFGLRLVGAVLGVLTVAIFYLLTIRLFPVSVALAGSTLFATTSLVLTVSRSASASVMFLSLLAIVAVGYMVRFYRRQSFAWIVAACIISLSLYVPGLIIFVLLAAIWQFSRIRRSLESLPMATIVISAICASVLLAPLVVNLIREPELWRQYLGIASTLPAPLDMVKGSLRAISNLFVISNENPLYWLGRQPVLDVFGSTLFVLGAWSLYKRRSLDRTWLLFGVIVVTLLWTGISGNETFIITTLPFVALVVAFGLYDLLQRWYRVFPRNPIARSVGLVLVCVAVVLSANFQLRRYYIAWPNNQQTKQVFNQTLPK